MEKDLRNTLLNTTQATRRLLEDEFARQLEGTFDIFDDGKIEEKPAAPLTPAQRLVRGKIVAAILHRRGKGETAKESVAGYRRECAFTLLNRLAALKMMEARGIIQPCVSKGPESSGFKEFGGFAPGLALLPDKGYRLYLECLFDEIGREVGVLFDRADPASLLWPARTALDAVLDRLNDPALASVWAQDETIGWIYQYYNDPAERKKMRDESATPRNSRELAVRNQFFTPRYVVEFLTDNTLGRIWYEMTKGDTALKDCCRYLVRPPAETFLAPGATPSAPTELPHRPIKDPRNLRLLDPACGSMHFGLYAFDLLEAIYAEAWDKEIGTLRQDYPERDALLRDIPRLIVEHNIHGIDIDPRAAQIAALALWLRAQRSWKDRQVPAAARPSIRRSHIVCAAPMPGNKTLLREFVDTEIPERDRPVFSILLHSVFDHLQLAGDAGSLLRIDEAIALTVEEAERLWRKSRTRSRELFDGDTLNRTLRPGAQQELSALEAAVAATGADDQSSSGDFWTDLEPRLYSYLAAYAEHSASASYSGRLFADDAAQGFAFIDNCRERYDVIVMNPPFGEWSAKYKAQSRKAYPNSYNDILGAFVERGGELLVPGGRLGAITSRTCFFLSSFTKWREEVVLKQLRPELLVDLGYGVMDAAMVEAAAYVLAKPIAAA